jgi:TolB-like protein/tRNA A-37 threonylcarbamoyl transferase component Bud32/Tfp pilus assembly protein PilF
VRESIGPYRILEKLGEGGMGVVYLGLDERLQRRVAIKTIHDAVADKTARERLRREARTAAAINHPGICQVFEIGEDRGELFLAMELLEGESLAVRLERGPLPLAEALATAIAVLSALDALHRCDVVHRDLKPSNVFLTPHGVKLLDFGLALPLELDRDAGERLTRTGVFVGTPAFMAPEQWTGTDVGPATDLFAVGALLLEMVAGVPAFTGGNAAEIFHAVLHGQPASLTGGSAVEAADRVIQRALAKRPAERPPSAAAMADDLRAVLSLVDGSEAPAAVVIHRMLVVPFRLLKPDEEIDFLPFGLADALVTSLSGVEGLVVKSSHVGARYAGAELDLAAIEREAGVHLVLTGTLLRAGDRLRVGAQLLEVPGGTLVWSETTQVPLGDVFQLQDDLAKRIVESLALKLAPSRRRALQSDVPANARAYEYFLRANQLSYNFGMLSSARDLYRACLEEDPSYAPAWARLGRVYRVRGKYAHGDAAEDLALAEEAFRKALEINPDLAAAHNLFAYYEIEELGRAADAMVRLLEQTRRAPTDPDLLAGLVVACRFCGLLDASVEADRRARRLDPGIRTSVAYTHWMRGDYESAILHDDEDLGWIHYYALPMLGRADEAIALCRERARRTQQPIEHGMLVSAYAALERDRDECVATTRVIRESSFHDPEGLYFVMRNLVRVGEHDVALDMLTDIVGRGFCCDGTLAADPWLDPVRETDRFRAAAAQAREGRLQATRRYAEAGGEALLGPGPEEAP